MNATTSAPTHPAASTSTDFDHPVASRVRACPLCRKQSDGAPPASGLVSCPICSLLYRARPDERPEADFWTGYVDNVQEQSYDKQRRAYYEAFWRVVRRLPNRTPHAQQSVLDIGCVPGHLLAVAAEDDWEIHGAELSESLCTMTSDHCGARMWCGHVESIDFGAQRFDLVVLSEMLRHTSDPVAVLAKARAVLRPGGAVVIREANTNHPRTHARIRNPHPFDMQMFAPSTAAATLGAAGFDDVQIRSSPQSLLTTHVGAQLARRAPRLYRLAVRAANAAIRASDLVRPDHPVAHSFLAIGFANHTTSHAVNSPPAARGRLQSTEPMADTDA